MMMISKLLILKFISGVFIFSNMLNAYADIPKDILSFDKFVRDIKLPISNKILQMQQNYIENSTLRVSLFTSDTETLCKTGVRVPFKQNVFKILKTVSGKDVKTETKIYYGCSGEISFKEISISSKLYNSYEFLGPNGISIFKGIKNIQNNVITTNLYFNNQLVTKMIEIQKKDFLEIVFKRYPFSISMSYFKISFNFSRTLADPGNYLIRVLHNGRVQYYDSLAKPISFAKFQKNIRFRSINFFVEGVFEDLPVTKFLNTGSTNDKLLEELRNIQTFLLTGTNLEYVKSQINIYIKEVEDGNIQDNRRKR